MNFKSVEKLFEGKNVLLVFLMALIVIVIIDCNTKMFSKMVEGNSPSPPKGVCGRDFSAPQKNPTNVAKSTCGFDKSKFKREKVTGYDEELVLHASVDKPLGPTIPRTMQQEYTILKSFGLTKMPDVINYIPGAGPQEFQKAPGVKVSGPPTSKRSNKEVHIRMYYAPWCGHSKKAHPEMKKFVSNNNGKVKDGVTVKGQIIDSDKQPDEIKKQQVSGFPTFKAHLIKDGKEVINYVLQLPERTLSALENAVNDAVNKVKSM